MDDDEKLDEETDNEEVGDEKARAVASPDLPSSREVQDRNLTHIPFTGWCNHGFRGRARRSGQQSCERVEPTYLARKQIVSELSFCRPE